MNISDHLTTAFLLELLADVLLELDKRASGIDTTVETLSDAMIETNWATVSRDGDGRWNVVYYDEGSAEVAHSVDTA